MSPELAAKYPDLKSLKIISERFTGRIDINNDGFYAMIMDGSNTYFINPVVKGSGSYISYDKRQAAKNFNNPFFELKQ